MMNGRVHIVIAFTSSMILTFLLDCVLLQTKAYNSLIQEFFMDVFHDFYLIIRCRYDGIHSNKSKYIYIHLYI